VTFESVTNDSGQYTLTNLQPGTYTVKVSLQGFKDYLEENVQVTVNNIIRVDVTLQVGARTESVTVSAEASQLQTDKADVHRELNTQEVTNLPLSNYRNYQSLIDLVPGSTPSAFQNASVDTPARALTTNINGVVRFNNNTRLDGALNIMPWLPHHSAYVAPQESIQTVNISTNSFDAEQGLAGGAAITVQTKAGTNQLHGVLFDYLRNNALDARNFFTPVGSQAPKYILSMFGGNVGGPIKKDKLFFFANYDGMRDRQSYSNLYTIPTDAMKTGDLSATGANIYDPTTGDLATGKGRTVFAGGKIPQSLINPVAQKMLSLMPSPNVPGATFVNNFYTSGPRQFNRDMYDFKGDWVRSPKNTIWAKYSLMNSLVTSKYAFGDAGGPALSPDGGAGTGTVRVHVGTIGGYYAITPRFMVDGTIGMTRYVNRVRQPDFGTNFGLDVLHIPGTNGPDPRQSGKPYFIINGYSSMGMTDTWVPVDRHDYTYTYTANASWNKGKHDIRFGPDISRFGMNHWQPESNNGPRGTFTFNGGATTLNGGAAATNRYNGFADFLLGLPQQVQKSLQFYDPMSTREWQIALYFRDRWQATSNLTLNLGLRWEHYPLMDRGFHGIERYDPDTNKVLIGGLGGVDWNAGTTVSWKLFAPRFGVAYRLGKQGVLRTGYGITFDPYNLGRPMRSPYPAVIQFSVQGPTTYIPYGPILNGIPAITGPDINQGTLDILGTYSTNTLPKGEFRRGYVQSWNLTYERPLPFNLVWNVGYVGTKAVNIVAGTQWPINNSPVNTGQAGRPLWKKFGRSVATNVLQPWTGSNYHSLQTSLDRRFSHGLMLKTVYTWAHSIDNNGTDSDFPFGIPELFYRNRASSGFDRRHNFRTAFVYEMPFGAGRKWGKSGFANAIVGGWQINGVFSAVTGRPFTVGSSGSSLNAPGSSQVADQVLPEVKQLGGIGQNVPFFDPFAFRPVLDPRFGNSGRSTLYGPGLVNLDFGIFRSFKITESKELQFRAESFNFTNTPHFNNPSASASDMTTHKAADGTVVIDKVNNFMNITSAQADQRTFRFGLRFSF
ncbi:MAG TPA: TonB-dependent receptor, partial [Acidobacteriota bacterium]|nr:TonB-dependent receptor [Acidobacteriota bacterium]